jgi:glycosyltransferase involved in cell wall biosynthesis
MHELGMAAPHTLYLCYFGLREPLVQTQVLPYLRQLVTAGIRVSILTFEPRLSQSWTREEIAAARQSLEAEGIGWHYLKYHKRPSLPATLYDIAVGTQSILGLMRREGVNILHARNHVPALMGAIARKFRPAQLVFDIRGFMPEEYTDAGVWPENGYLYRGLKRVERYLLRVSDAFVLLTEKARDIVFPGCSDTDKLGRPIEVIPCCVDFERFKTVEQISREQLRAEMNLTDRRVIVYLGSFGGWYMTDQMTDFLAAAHSQDAATFSMILTQSPRQTVTDRMTSLGIAQENFLVEQVTPDEVPRYLRTADIAISFIKPCFSKQSSSPTKIAEYLASGLPVICNSGVGDLDKLINERRVGVLLGEFSRQGYLEALNEVEIMRGEENLAERLRDVARREFDLVGVGRTRYRRLYERLLKRASANVRTENLETI